MKTAQLAQAFETVSNMRDPMERMALTGLLSEKGLKVLHLYTLTWNSLKEYDTVSALLDESVAGEELKEAAILLTEAHILLHFLKDLAKKEYEVIQEGQ